MSLVEITFSVVFCGLHILTGLKLVARNHRHRYGEKSAVVALASGIINQTTTKNSYVQNKAL